MPEGHTIHRLARLHTEHLAGGPVRVTSPQGRFADAALLDGQVLEGASAVGKHLFHHYPGGAVVHVHLGLYGGFSLEPLEGAEPPEPVGQVRMRLLGRGRGPVAHVADLRGPTRCELVDEAAREAIAARLGPDPLDPAAGPERYVDRVRRSGRPLAALLLDQSVLAGVGNVYRAEALFRLGLDPFRPGRECAPETLRALWTELVELMELGVREGAIVTVRPEHDHGDRPRRGAHRPRNYVYQRDGWGCRVCSDYVKVTEVAGRSLFWCPSCQAG